MHCTTTTTKRPNVKTWTPEEIKALLLTKPLMVERSIVQLFKRQTADEQAAQQTAHRNNRGFNSADAKRMSFVAEFLNKGGHLTQAKALGVYAPRVSKYIGQLTSIANGKVSPKGPKIHSKVVCRASKVVNPTCPATPSSIAR